jgi:hypothetical protein
VAKPSPRVEADGGSTGMSSPQTIAAGGGSAGTCSPWDVTATTHGDASPGNAEWPPPLDSPPPASSPICVAHDSDLEVLPGTSSKREREEVMVKLSYVRPGTVKRILATDDCGNA